MINFDIHIYGVHERDDMINSTAEKLGLGCENIHYDDREERGLMIYTAKKAWLAPIPEGITHRIALADDVEVCDDFKKICEQIILAHPDKIISLFPYEYMKRAPEIEGYDTPYLKCYTLSGCAIIMPVQYIQSCFEYVEAVFNDNCADDEGIQAYAEAEKIMIITTIPATVQHIGDISIANIGCEIRRTVYYNKNPIANWSNKTILNCIRKEWFFSNHGRIKDEFIIQVIE